MLKIQTTYHINDCVYARFDLDNKIGEAWLQLPSSQTSRHNIELDGTELESGEELHRRILEGLLTELYELYPDKTIRHLFYAGCDVDNIKSITEEYTYGWRSFFVKLKNGSEEKYDEVPGDCDEEGFFLVLVD